MEIQDITSYIATEEANWKTTRVPITESKDWNMFEHIQRCKNVANAWFHTGKNDGERPYDDLVTPIIDIAFRSEGFDVKDIVPFVNDPENYYKSFLVKKFHSRWAKRIGLDTLIDQAVESSIIYDLVIFKNIKNNIEIVPLESIAFCDQTDVLSAPICIKHQYSIQDLLEFKGKWDDEKIDEAILMARQEKPVKQANDRKQKTPGRYIEVYELHGMLPESWLKEDGDPDKYVNQLQIINLYAKEDGTKDKITLYKGKAKKITETFDALKIDQVRSHGRACGKSIVERLTEPQVWHNYSAIKIKEKLDAGVDLFISDSDEIGNQKLENLPKNTILKQEKGATTTRLNGPIVDIDKYVAHQKEYKETARLLGSAAEPMLGITPASGTPLGTTERLVQQGQGIHEYRQGKIATFFADRLYKNWILKTLVAEMNKGEKWLDELSLEEMQYVADSISNKEANKRAVKLFIDKKPSDEIRQEDIEAYRDTIKEQWLKGGNKRFFEVMQDELKDLPIVVNVNITGKQAYLAQQADKLSNFVLQIMSNPQAFTQIPGIGTTINQILEVSGLNPINFEYITKNTINQLQQPQPAMATK